MATKMKGDNLAGIFDEVKGLGGNIDPCRAKLKIISVAKDHSQAGLRRYSVQMQIAAPKELAGQTHFENFQVGTAADPDAMKASTWKDQENWGARRMRDFIEKCKVPGFERLTPEEALKKANGGKVMIQFGIKTDKRKTLRDGSENQYFGQEQQTTRYYADGERKAEMLGKSPVKGAKLEPDDDEDTEEAPKAIAVKVKKKAEPEEDKELFSEAPKEEEDEEEEDEDEDEEGEDDDEEEDDDDED